MDTSDHPFDNCGNCGATRGENGAALKICGRCNVQMYCGRKCQTEHWLAHKDSCKIFKKLKEGLVKTTEPMPSDRIFIGAGVAITPVPVPQANNGWGFTYSPVPAIPPEVIDYPFWIDLPVSATLGFPLRLSAMGEMNNHVFNELANVLGLDPDPASASFGQVRWDGKLGPAMKPMGSMLIVRRDLEQLHINHVAALVRYLQERVKEITDVGQKKNKKKKKDVLEVDKTKLANRLSTPQAFRKFFELMKVAEMKDQPNAWEGVECPA